MLETDTRQQIIRKLRNSDEPALSAADLAEELDLSVRAINTHLDRLTANEKVQTHQIGNATAYYLDTVSEPRHNLPDHTCHRCGRGANELHDFGKVELDEYFESSHSEPSTSNFYILCRFCYHDLVAWLYNDENRMGSYPYVDQWEIPEDQKQEVIDDPEIDTEPSENADTP